MEEWKKVSLRDVTDIIGDGLHGTPLYSSDGEFAFINGNNLSNGSIEIKADTKMCDLSEYEKYKKELSDRTLFLSINGTIGNTAKYNGEKIILGKSACYLNVKKDYNLDFIYYVLRTPAFQSAISGLATGTTIKNVSLKTIREYEFSVPGYDGQARIAGILRAIDDKINLNNRINHNLEEQMESLFNELCIDKEGYTEASLTEIADYINGLAMQKFPVSEGEKGLPVLKIKELGQGFCDESSDRCTSELKPDSIIHDGDIVFSWSGTLMVDMWCGGTCGLNQHLFKVQSNKYPKWFYYMWTKHHLKNFIHIAKDKAVTMGHIKRGHLENAIVHIPSSELLGTLDKVFGPMLEQILKTRLENCKLCEERDLLLPRLLTGEITC